MYYLDTPNGAGMYQEAKGYSSFVDKSAMIGELYRYARTESKYIAITRPRRFGKTMAANMLAAFFTKGLNSEALFNDLAAARDPEIWSLRNSFHVIHMDFLPELGSAGSFKEFIELIRERMILDIREIFPALEVNTADDVPSLLDRTGEQFIFILDEWDAIFEKRFMTLEDREDYVVFLRGLLKNRAYVHMALLTGILPIAKYTTGSPLNMFREFNAFAKIGFEKYYGFSEDEIRMLIERRKNRKENRERDVDQEKDMLTAGSGVPSLEEIRLWYDGYLRRADGGHMYNPDSVCNALEEGGCRNFWKGTGPMNDISNLIAKNAFEVRDEIFRMVAGEKIEIRLDGFGAEEIIPRTKRDILSAIVIYGFLTYYDGKLFIPNLELSQKFVDLLDRGTLGVHLTLEESRELLKATLEGHAKEVTARIEAVHDEQIPFITYSDENSLACVILYAYYGALDWYEIRREEKSGKGFVDFLFTPVDPVHIPIIMELKYNRSAKAAIAQIREKDYIRRMKNYPEVLFVGVNYSERTKKHTCLIERTSFEKEQHKTGKVSIDCRQPNIAKDLK